MTTLSDLIRDANKEGWSSRQIAARAKSLGHAVGHATVANYIGGQVPKDSVIMLMDPEGPSCSPALGIGHRSDPAARGCAADSSAVGSSARDHHVDGQSGRAWRGRRLGCRASTAPTSRADERTPGRRQTRQGRDPHRVRRLTGHPLYLGFVHRLGGVPGWDSEGVGCRT